MGDTALTAPVRRAPPLVRGRRIMRRFAYVPLLLPATAVTVAVFWVAMSVLLVMSVYPFLASGTPRLTAAAWTKFLTDPYYWGVVGTTLQLGLVVTVLALAIGYPAAYAMARLRRPGVLLVAYVILFSPILVSVVVRTYGWMLLLAKDGAVNFVLLRAGVVHAPVALVFNMTGIVIAMVHILLPFMVFPILSVLAQLTPDLREAAMDLGGTRWETFRRVTLPLSLPGIVSGSQIVFTLTISAFVTPFLMGGGKVQVLTAVIYRDMEAVNLAFASVVAFVMLGLAAAILVVGNLLARQAYARAEVLRT
jgi:putative spermidine/putrescine transport system permease protein